jgi:hypothetical protein
MAIDRTSNNIFIIGQPVENLTNATLITLDLVTTNVTRNANISGIEVGNIIEIVGYDSETEVIYAIMNGNYAVLSINPITGDIEKVLTQGVTTNSLGS